MENKWLSDEEIESEFEGLKNMVITARDNFKIRSREELVGLITMSASDATQGFSNFSCPGEAYHRLRILAAHALLAAAAKRNTEDF